MFRSREILRIQVHEGPRFISAAAAGVAGVAKALEFGPADVERIGKSVEALCNDVANNHFDNSREAQFSVIVNEVPGALVIRIEDEGLPYPVECSSLDHDSLVGRLHATGLVDSIRHESHVGGNVVEISVRQSPDHLAHLQEQPDPGTAPVAADAPVTVRALQPDDAASLARCVYRCYGYTYANDFVYYPEQVLALIERGLLRSFVGVDADGEVVGHSGVVRDTTASRVAESGIGLVDPRYRSHHLLSTIKTHQIDAIRELGLVGLYSDAVAVHPITQKSNLAIGAHEIGVLLAEIPAFTRFRGFDAETPQRGTVVVYYRAVGDTPPREVVLPRRYRQLLQAIYARLGLPRNVRDVPEHTAMPPESKMHVEIKSRRGLARIEVEGAGADLVSRVESHVRELCLHRIDVIHLDLRLDDEATITAVDDLAGLGFFFGAVIPELRSADILRLQYLNNVTLDPQRIVLYSDEAKELLRQILADR